MMPVHKITSKQFIWAIYKSQIGIGVLTLPRRLSESSGTAGIFSLFMSWLLALLISYIVAKSMTRCPGMSFQQAIARAFGRVAGGVINSLWAAYTTMVGVVVLLSTIFIIQIWILKDFPTVELAIIMLIPIYMVSRLREQGLGRFAEFLFLATIWLYPMLLYPLQEANVLNILPLLPEGFVPILKGIPAASISYLGIEVALFLIPYLEKPEKAFRDLAITNTMTTLLYLIVTVISFFYFDIDQIKSHLWPTLELFKTVRFPFLERFELVFLPYYLMVILYTCMVYFHLSADAAAQLMRRPKPLVVLRLTVASVILSTFFFQPDYDSIEALNLLLDRSTLFAFAFPFLWLGMTWLRSGALERGSVS